MSGLKGQTVATTYEGLIKTADNTPINTTPKALSDGDGNVLPMEVSTVGINWSGNQDFTGATVLGVSGAQGATGAQGLSGAQGANGTDGAQGIAGAQGAQGIEGAQGANGTNGAQGAQGIEGAQGATGTGAQGAQGIEGAQGATGSKGDTGAQGAQGPGAMGLSIKNLTPSTPVTGFTTVETVVGSILIPANSVTPGNVYNLNLRVGSTKVVSGTSAFKLYLGTSIGTSGTNLATGTSTSFQITSSSAIASVSRQFYVNSATATNILGASLGFTDWNAGLASAAQTPLNALNVDWTVDQYITLTVTLSNASNDAFIYGYLFYQTNGAVGAQGATGAQGPSGGEKGATGAQGAAGVNGLENGTGISSLKNADSLVATPVTADGLNAISLGTALSNYANYTVMIGSGTNNSDSSRVNSILIGTNLRGAQKSIAIGNDCALTYVGESSIQIGNNLRTNANYQVNIGYGNQVSVFTGNSNCVVLGVNNTTSSEKSFAIGINNVIGTAADATVFIGEGHTGSGGRNLGLVYQTNTGGSGEDKIAIGTLAVATADRAIAIGRAASSTHANSVALGTNVASKVTNTTHVEGLNVNTVSEYADNTAAVAGGLPLGQIYRTGDLLKIVHA